ncbi:MAG: AraC family transcriptional regulator ligand-binding domain-containing protein [Verrucomicrobiota bacterium]
MKVHHQSNQEDPLSKSTSRANAASMVVAFAHSRGMTWAEIEAVIQIPRIALANAENRLPDDIIHKLLRRLGELEPDKALPLRMAEGAPLEQFAHAFQHAKNLREAILFFCRHRQIASDRLALSFRESDASGFLSIEHPMDHIDQGRMGIFSMAFFKRIVDGIVVRPIKITQFRCAYASPGAPSEYERFFGCPTCFDAHKTGLVFPRSSLEEPLRFANSEVFDFCNEYFNQVLQNLGHSTKPDEFERLQAAIMENAKLGIFDATSAAKAAHMSLRSAQRIASARNTSVKELIRDIRVSLAKRMVQNPNFDFEEVSEFLGYSEESSFRRAFKKWTGTTPVAFRNST